MDRRPGPFPRLRRTENRRAAWIVALSVLLLGEAPGSAEPTTGKIILIATGFRSEQGEVLIHLANSREDYESDTEGFRLGSVKAEDGRATFVFADVPYGEYAMKVFHDENSNRELDIGWTGPEERYGFSNNARGLLGPPDYDKARFELAEPEKTIEIAVE